MAHFLIQCLHTKLSGIKHGFFKKRRAFFLSDKSDGKFTHIFDFARYWTFRSHRILKTQQCSTEHKRTVLLRQAETKCAIKRE